VMRGEAHPLQPKPFPMHRAVQQLSPLNSGGACPIATPYGFAPGRRCRPPSPRGWWSLTRSIPTSHVPGHSRRHRPFRVRCRMAASCAMHRLAPIRGESTCENQAPTRCRGLGDIGHGRDAFRRVARKTLTHSPESCGSGFDPTVARLAHPFATSPLRSHRLAAMG
jgi:hypothetical protein